MFNATNILILITIIAYLAMVVYIGVKFSKQNSDTDNFYLGGRKLGPFVTAMSAEASDMSSWLLMGLPGVALAAGLAEASWTAIGLAIGTYLNWLIVAKRIRRYSIKLNAITVPEFFTKRYKDQKKILQTIAAVVIVVFFIPYTGSGFSACGKLFTTLFPGVNYHTAMIVSAIVIAVYTTLGGFLAASTSDFIQSIVMTIAIVVVFGFGVSVAGGWNSVFDNAAQLPGYLNVFQGYDAANNAAGSYGALPVASTLAWGLGYFGMPHILLRFMAARKEEELTFSRRIASVWVVISMAVATVIGVVGLAMSNVDSAKSFFEGKASETVLINIALYLASKGWVCALICGVILAGVLAATMSTADSQLLAAASSVTEDILTSKFGIKFDVKKQMIVARATVLFISVLGIIIAWNPDSSVFRIVSFAWAGFGAAFGPIVLLALFWKRSNLAGAISGMVAGGIMVFVWKFVIAPVGGVLSIYELLPAFIIALIVNVVVSLCTKAPSEDIVKEFEEVSANK
ncbi:MAG: sodium/proline symporter [Lachnospiraceae bacterium]|nr:sodium/proline symporter [Lachnospiraceae bacterium]